MWQRTSRLILVADLVDVKRSELHVLRNALAKPRSGEYAIFMCREPVRKNDTLCKVCIFKMRVLLLNNLPTL